jgi:type I restriction enzyme, S subunit
VERVIDKSTIKKYPAYKDSGVEWIEDVPSHWEVKKFKRVFYEIKKRSNPELNCGSISFGKVVYKDDEKIPESTKKSYQVVQKGDFLVNPLNLNYDLISLRIALSDIDVVVSSGYIVLSNSVKLNKTFYKYFLHRFDVAFMKLLGSGVRQTLNWNDIANCELVFPPLPEQTAIAAFLDRKTALIDQAIDIKQKQIELLKERKFILIHKAVTRGLNPIVKLKDSGVEWIGEIPEHWEVLPGFRVYKENKTNNIGMKEKVVLSLSYGNIVIKPEEKLVGLVPESFETYQIVKPGDIIIRCMDLQNDKTSLRTGIAINDGIITSAYLNLNIINGNNSNYMYNFLHSLDTTKVLYKFGTGLRQNLNYSDFKRMPILVPPKVEQNQIVEFIEKLKIKIATAISLKEQEIEKLKEYKATLINSAVTGKIKVHHDGK